MFWIVLALLLLVGGALVLSKHARLDLNDVPGFLYLGASVVVMGMVCASVPGSPRPKDEKDDWKVECIKRGGTIDKKSIRDDGYDNVYDTCTYPPSR